MVYFEAVLVISVMCFSFLACVNLLNNFLILVFNVRLI